MVMVVVMVFGAVSNICFVVCFFPIVSQCVTVRGMDNEEMDNEEITNQTVRRFHLSYENGNHYNALMPKDPRFVTEKPGVLEALGLAKSKARLTKQNSESATSDSDEETAAAFDDVEFDVEFAAAVEASRVSFAEECKKRIQNE